MMKKSIRICPENEDKIKEALKICQKRCSARTITFNDILNSVHKIESHFNCIPKYHMKGLELSIDMYAQYFSTRYRRKGTPYSTFINVRHSGKGWVLTDIYRAETRADYKTRFTVIVFPDSLKDSIIQYYTNFQ